MLKHKYLLQTCLGVSCFLAGTVASLGSYLINLVLFSAEVPQKAGIIIIAMIVIISLRCDFSFTGDLASINGNPVSHLLCL